MSLGELLRYVGELLRCVGESSDECGMNTLSLAWENLLLSEGESSDECGMNTLSLAWENLLPKKTDLLTRVGAPAALRRLRVRQLQDNVALEIRGLSMNYRRV